MYVGKYVSIRYPSMRKCVSAHECLYLISESYKALHKVESKEELLIDE